MLPTFVIGLREGLEAALIVGIIAAFLRKQGRRDLLRWVWSGVGGAVLLCVAVGVALDAYSRSLPQRQQEGLETVIGVIAVGMVTYMVVWMRRHSRQLKGQLEGMAVAATSRGGQAMVLMAFLAVIREGFETVVFLLAAFNESGSGPSAAIGASTGIAVAAALGWGIYRGGVRLNLSRFFRATGLVLVFVAAGLVVNALHTAHEAGWLNAGQAGTVDLSWLVRPGSVQSSLLTGMLGIQAHPVTAEVIGWLLYLIPVGCYVAWPPGRRVPLRALAGLTGALAALCALGATLLAVLAPGRPARDSRVVALDGGTATVRVDATTYHLTGAGSAVRAAIPVEVYRGQLAAEQTRRALTVAEVVAANGGRLPIGVRPGADGTVASTSTSRSTVTAWIEPRSGYLVAARIDDTVTTTLANATVLPARHTARMLASDDAAARAALDRVEQRDGMSTGSDWLRGVAVACAVAALAALAGERWLRRERAALAAGPARELVRS